MPSRGQLVTIERAAVVLLVSAAVCACVMPCAGVRYIDLDWVPKSTISRLPNAAPDDVREMLGEPTYVQTDGLGSRWLYTNSHRLAEFWVCFDREGKVTYWYYDR